MVFSEKMVFKANAFSEEKKYSLLIKIIVCQGAMTFMNLCVGTQLQYKKKKLWKSRRNQQITVSNALQAVLKTRKINFVHNVVIDRLPHLHKIVGSISRSIKTN